MMELAIGQYVRVEIPANASLDNMPETITGQICHIGKVGETAMSIGGLLPDDGQGRTIMVRLSRHARLYEIAEAWIKEVLP